MRGQCNVAKKIADLAHPGDAEYGPTMDRRSPSSRKGIMSL